jgi:hypothetical protein
VVVVVVQTAADHHHHPEGGAPAVHEPLGLDPARVAAIQDAVAVAYPSGTK